MNNDNSNNTNSGYNGNSPNTGSSPKRKQSLYFPEDMLLEIQQEANRQDRSLSWIVQQAWRIARQEMKKFPSINDDDDGSVDEYEFRGNP